MVDPRRGPAGRTFAVEGAPLARGLAAVAFTIALGCSGGAMTTDAAGGAGATGSAGATAGAGGGGAGGGSADGGNKTCFEIRRCSIDMSCVDDACFNVCKQGASAAEQAAFDALTACTHTTGGCTNLDDTNCVCLAQCIQDPPCATELGACIGNMLDPLCDVRGCA